MKKLIFLLFVLFPVLVLGQTQTMNYIKTKTYKVPTQTSIPIPTIIEAYQNVDYLDGLGRPVQQVAHQQSPSGGDIVSQIEYDSFGRQIKDYLPYVPNSSASLNYNNAVLTGIDAFYNTAFYENTTNPYSQKEFEHSPLNRVLTQAFPGEDWRLGNGHEIRFAYQTNTSDDQIRIFGVSFKAGNIENPELEQLGTYSPSQLFKAITKDENWTANQSNLKEHTIEEFKDKRGKIILKRNFATVGNGSTIEKYDTYYVYDQFDNLTFIIPPKASDLIIQSKSSNSDADKTSNIMIDGSSSPFHITATNSIRLIDEFHAKAGSIFTAVIVNSTEAVLNNLCYQYKYDAHKRQVEKKMPGNQWEYIIYDKFDRPILAQDGNLRTYNKWLFTKYDAFSRPVYTGEYINNIEKSRTSVQALAVSQILHESKQAQEQIISGTSINYTNLAFPNSGINLFTITYYDDYLNISLYNGTPANSISYDKTPLNNIKGLVACSKTRVLDTNNWITSVLYYNNKSQLICNYVKNTFLDTERMVKMKLDFKGNILETTSTQNKGSNNTVTLIDTFTYDNGGRILTCKQKINAQDPEFIVSNTYDSLGKLISKGVGGKVSNVNRLQTVNFTYNVRGWLKGINDSDSGNSNISMGTNDLFGFKITYNNPSSGKALYNGNISQTFWKTSYNDSSVKNYNYLYDAQNRLLNAVDNLEKFSETVRYDKNGNITYLKRLGEIVGDPIIPSINNASHFGLMDDLTYSYDLGNRLMKVSDVAQIDSFGFKDDAVNMAVDSQDDYSYDDNGNMKTDSNKGIIDIQYNYLNLPSKIILNSGTVEYSYDATGIKQQKTVNGMKTDYASGFVYENKNNVLKFISHAEGYAAYNSGNFDYIYQYKDHLGNVRLSYGDTNNNGAIENNEIIEENNFYPFGLKHKGYNNITILGKGNAIAQKYKYQGQERQNDIGLDWDSFKWRNYDPALARFMNVDPLGEQYNYQSGYNFSENRVIDGIELEGLESVLLRDSANNHPVILAANSGQYKDDPINKTIHVFAHGNPSMFFNDFGKTKDEQQITTGSILNKTLEKTSALWRHSKSKEGFTLVIHACRTGRYTFMNGKFTDPVAAKISASKEMKGVMIIAPDERDGFSLKGKEIGPQKTKHVDYNADYLYNDPKTHGQQTRQFGHWNIFMNGLFLWQNAGSNIPKNRVVIGELSEGKVVK